MLSSISLLQLAACKLKSTTNSRLISVGLCHSLLPVKRKEILAVYWMKPKRGYFKVNVNGTFLVGGASTGGYVWDHARTVVFAAAVPLSMDSALYVEAKALILALNQCVAMGLREVEVETDSLELVDSIEGKRTVPWKIEEDILAIRQVQ